MAAAIQSRPTRPQFHDCLFRRSLPRLTVALHSCPRAGSAWRYAANLRSVYISDTLPLALFLFFSPIPQQISEAALPAADFPPAAAPMAVNQAHLDLLRAADRNVCGAEACSGLCLFRAPRRDSVPLFPIRQVQQLETQIQELQEEKQTFNTRLEALQAQVQRRDKEIERLGQLLEGGRPLEAVYAEAQHGHEERRMAQLETQVELLQQTNRELNEQLQAAKEKDESAHAKVQLRHFSEK